MSNTCQFGAVTFKVPHEFKFIAFAGTGDELVGWREDFKLSYLYPVEAQILAKEYLNKNVKLNDLLIYTGGHSKGGNLAVSALMEANMFTRHRVKYAFNFDGPGFLDEEITSKKYKKINKKIRTYNPIESVVGVLLEMDSFKKTISSKNHGVNQHDAYFWEINDNKFKEGKLTKFALDIHKKSIDITKKYSKEQLELFVNTVFNLLDKSGYTLKSELDKVDIKKLIKATHELNHLDKEKKEIIIAILKLIVFGVKEEN
jgi:hypothetical protein